MLRGHLDLTGFTIDRHRIDEFTAQLYVPDELTDRVRAAQPYAAHRGQRLNDPNASNIPNDSNDSGVDRTRARGV